MRSNFLKKYPEVVIVKNPKKIMAQSFEPWMKDALISWLNDGWSLYSFPSKHNVSSKTWSRILRDAPELQTIKREYLRKLPNFQKDRDDQFNEMAAG